MDVEGSGPCCWRPSPPLSSSTRSAASSRLLLRLISAHARLREGEGSAVYVSGDQRATTELLVQLGVAPERVAGDSCARTTWENAALTSSCFQPPPLQSQRLA